MADAFTVQNMDLYYGSFHALKNVNLNLASGEITAFIGPSGCGKSTFLKSLNRMNDLVEGCRISGDIKLDGVDIYKDKMDVNVLRKRVGMVFQKPNPFPMSIYDNIAYGPRTHGIHNKAQLDEIVERSLRGAAIWDEVKDRLNKSALGMSGGQQQRLCIARALAVEPEVLLMDEPTSALDPISTSKVEELATELKENYTIVMVTHNMQQAARISDKTAFFLLGELVEMGPTERVFATPVDKRTEDYISGRDQASDIAEITLHLHPDGARTVGVLDDLYAMGDIALHMVKDAIAAYVQVDLSTAAQVIARDDDCDAMFSRISKEIAAYIAAHPGDAETALDLFMIDKYLERLGDHAVNIAEWVEFLKTGVHKSRKIV